MPKGFQKGHKNFSSDWNKEQKGMRHSPKSEFKVGSVPWNKDRKHSPETIEKLKAGWTPERKAKHIERLAKLRALKNKKINWKTTPRYKKWRTKVFKRDKYQCVIGGKAHGNKIQADHIKPQSLYPELRFVVSNGRTLCRPCHKKTPT